MYLKTNVKAEKNQWVQHLDKKLTKNVELNPNQMKDGNYIGNINYEHRKYKWWASIIISKLLVKLIRKIKNTQMISTKHMKEQISTVPAGIKIMI